MEFKHKSVLLEETIEGLDIKPDGIYVDGTLGGAGHAGEVCRKLSAKGRFIGIDQDQDAIIAASERLAPYKQATIIRSNYCYMVNELKNLHRNGLTDDICQFSGCLNRCLCSRSHNMLRNIFCKFIFSVITNDPVKFFFVVAIDNISSRTTLSLIHSHIKRRIHTIGEATLLII